MYTTIETLKQMIAEPASKEWFEKYGTPTVYPDAFISEREEEIYETV